MRSWPLLPDLTTPLPRQSFAQSAADLTAAALVISVFWVPFLLALPAPTAVAGTALAVTVGLCMLTQHRFPTPATMGALVATTIGAVLGCTSDPMIATAWCLRALARQHHQRVSWFLAPTALAVVFLLFVAMPGVERVLLAAIALGAGLLVGAAEGSRLDQAARSARLASDVHTARELHDSLGHSLALIRAEAGTALFLEDTDHADSRAALIAVESQVKDALGQLQRTVKQLRDGEQGHPRRPLVFVIDEVRRAGLEVRVEPADALRLIEGGGPDPQSILREMMINALRHSASQHCDIVIDIEEARMSITARNSAAATSIRAGHGLTGIRERAREAGGDAHWYIDDGTFTVCADVPRGRP